jgi:hypothetical protein
LTLLREYDSYNRKQPHPGQILEIGTEVPRHIPLQRFGIFKAPLSQVSVAIKAVVLPHKALTGEEWIIPVESSTVFKIPAQPNGFKVRQDVSTCHIVVRVPGHLIEI